ncbi:MAG: CHASE2 domain-containing protein [Pseudoxanthomonas sp.]
MKRMRSYRQRLQGRALTAVAAVALGVALLLSNVTRPLDNQLYSLLLPSIAPAPNPRIVMVTIDQDSLRELGPRPWSRRVLAQALDRLTGQHVRGVGLDVLLSDPALFDPEGDALLAKAMRRNGHVVLPVHAEPGVASAPLIELQPIPEFATSAAALGHVDPGLDADGVARTLYLQAGPGAPRWPAMALALSRFDPALPPQTPQVLPTSHGPDAREWTRDEARRIAYAKPDSFRTLSFADVLDGRVPTEALQGAWVLLGNASSPQDLRLGVPMRGADTVSPLEFQAHALNAVLAGATLQVLPLSLQLLLTALLVTLPLLVSGLPGLARMRWTMLLACVGSLGTAWLLMLAHRWFPPASALATLAVGTTLLALHHLRQLRSRTHTDPRTGLTNASGFQHRLALALREAAQQQRPVSLLMLQLDRARSRAGTDAMLYELGRRLSARARRPQDRVAHLGQGRFAILLPDTPAHAAGAIATTVHVDLGEHPAEDELGTVSIGLHTFDPASGEDPASLLEGAQDALLKARTNGGNTTACHRREVPAPPAPEGLAPGA